MIDSGTKAASSHELTVEQLSAELVRISRKYFIIPHENDSNLLHTELKESAKIAIAARSEAPLRLLCTTLTEASAENLDKLTGKLRTYMQGGCDWALLVYRGDMHIAAAYKEVLSTIDLNGSRVVLFAYDSNRLDILDRYGKFPKDMLTNRTSIAQAIYGNRYNHKLFPKPMLLTALIPLLADYQYVWIFDDDIEVANYNVTALLKKLICSFDSRPYISQPLIHHHTQFYDYLNQQSWEHRPDIIVSETGFIEIQTPIFHTGFLNWYLRNIVGRVLWQVHTLGADWGFDQTFCTAARLYAEEEALYHYRNCNKTAEITDKVRKEIRSKLRACTIIVDGPPVHHHDWKATRNEEGPALHRATNNELEGAMAKMFPFLVLNGRDPRASPSSNHDLQFSTAFMPDCPL
jgi:hypothetical protein